MQRYFAESKNGNNFLLKNDDIYHIKTVMRMKESEKIIVVYENIPYLCELENVNQNLTVSIKEQMEIKKDKLPKITLIIPLLKEQKMDLILQKATELGVYEIIPVILSRSIIKIDEKKESNKIDRWMRIVKEASEQSHRNEIPTITSIKKIEELELKDLNIVCSTRERANNIKYTLKNNSSCDTINVVVGPEGGLTEKEEEILLEKGFEAVTLGTRIMRVETVPIYIMSVINYEYLE